MPNRIATQALPVVVALRSNPFLCDLFDEEYHDDITHVWQASVADIVLAVTNRDADKINSTLWALAAGAFALGLVEGLSGNVKESLATAIREALASAEGVNAQG